jgi:acetylornithine/succinyldiaminopimelate/putrescine aminotransferase
LLLIFDEIQCGLGRLGRRFAYEHFNVTPDVLLLGKPLGGGLPLAALLTREGIAACLQVGDHGSTFGGNPVAAAGGLVLMQELERPGFLDRVRRLGEHLGQGLTALKKQFPQRVAEVRGLGFMWGLELRESGQRWVELCLERGLIINCTSGNVLRCLPALTITEQEIDHALNILRSVFMEIQEG